MLTPRRSIALLGLALAAAPARAHLRSLTTPPPGYQAASTEEKPKAVTAAPKEKRWGATYFAEFSGPSADFSLPLESYSLYSEYYSPMKLYQSLNLNYKVGPDTKVGLDLAVDKNLQDDVQDYNFNYYQTDTIFFDPAVYVQFYNLIDNPTLWMNGKFSFDLPLSEASKQNEYITDIYASLVWNFKLGRTKWYAALNTDMWFFFFKHNYNYNRASMSIGHNVGYRFDDRWCIDTYTIFDWALRTGLYGYYQFNTAAVDRLKIQVQYQPIPNSLQFGAFLLSPIYQRSLDRMSVGLNMNIWL